AGADLIAISPSGSAAAVYDEQSRSVQVVGGLPGSPQVVGQFDASGITGHATALAISDDATVALVKFMDSDAVSAWILNRNGSSPVLLDAPAGFAFFPHRNDAVVTDGRSRSVFVIQDAGNANTQIPLLV